MALSIDDLLNSLQNPNKKNGKLENTKDTWRRIQAKDSFSELGIQPSELDSFLSEWINDNPYSAIA